MARSKRVDPRFLQIGVLSSYAILAREVFNFERAHWVTAACVAWAIALDLFLGRSYYKKTIPPISAVIVGLACTLLVDAKSPVIYLLAVTLAILSKALLTYRGKHFFNPAGFGAAVVLVLLPDKVSGIQQLFVGYYVPSVLFLLLGLVTVTVARQLEVSLSWFAGFLAFALARALLMGVHPLVTVVSVLGPGFLLFTFHMISDPATTPKTHAFRIGFGIVTAAIDAVFRFYQIPNGQFYALMLMNSLMPWIWELEGSAPKVRLTAHARAAHFAALVLICLVSLGMRNFPGAQGAPVVIDKNEVVRPRAFSFKDVTHELGIRFAQEDPVLDLHGNTRLIFPGTGVAVADFDGDGKMDILLINSAPGSKNHLYLRRGDHFVDKAEEWGIASTNVNGATVSATVFDYDNDGRPDVFLARMGCSMLFHNLGDHFEDVSKVSGVTDCRNSFAALPVDYDGDGKLDLYVVRYWPDRDFFKLVNDRAFPESISDARDGGQNTLYRNIDGRHFEDRTEQDGGGDTHWSLDALAGDFAGDGVPRLVVANDFGRSTLYAIRNGKLVDETATAFPPNRRNSMTVTIGDLASDGRPDILLTDISERGFYSHGNFLWHFGANGIPSNLAEERGLDSCGWAWGAAFADFGLTGRQDAYIANGFITGKGKGEYRFASMVAMALPTMLQSNRTYRPPLGDKSFFGHERGCVFVNNGAGFELASTQVGINDRWDGRAVALVDLDNDGRMSLVVTTQDGPPHVLKNTIEPTDRWIGFRLVGTRSNRDAAGARVEVRQGDRKWYRWATGGHSGFMASSDPRLHVGVPDGGNVDVEVRWPSGARQELKALKTGRYYTVREGENIVSSESGTR